MPTSRSIRTYSSHYIPPSGFAGSPGHFRPTSYSGQFESQVHTYRPSGFNNYNRGHGRGNAKGRPICQVCSKIGHTTVQCYHRYNSNYNGAPPQFGSPPQFESSGSFNSGNLGNFLPTHNSVGYGSRFGSGNFGNQQLHNFTVAPHLSNGLPLLANQTTAQDPAWYMDSGTTDHVTSDLSQMHSSMNYEGAEQLQVGNGEFLNISHIGFTSSPSSLQSKCLHLKNVLCVPNITKNLLSISKFTKDNNVVVEFHSYCCVFKDKVTKTVLLQGELKAGLHQLNLTSTYLANCNDQSVSIGVKSFVSALQSQPSKNLFQFIFV
ncbi:hypothetical protein Patl1_15302 [Pistacia atlantica]|uniref:Uncharacterized protein n=1 Tax=Pistacia atlantica TaxID=434234 RepID=A0ACC1B9P9_9ROSI|nr:hypothetical protein Patl1_15302 [Pistacia atlantica]